MLLLLGAGRGAYSQQEEPSIPPKETQPASPQSTPSPTPEEAKPKRLIRPDDKRRTLRSYRHNLAYNFLEVVKPGNYRPLLVTAGLTGASVLLDDEGVDYFRDHPHERFGRIGADLGGSIAISGLTVGLFSAGRIARGDRFRAATYDLSQAIIINQVYTLTLKLATRRERPDGSNRHSFPSGHASNLFATATVIARHYRRLAIPSYAVASYIAVSRLAANKHYLSDSVAGAGLGFSVGRVVVHRNGRPPDALAPKLPAISLMPDPGPSGDGLGIALVASF